jgi:hypothetical protein
MKIKMPFQVIISLEEHSAHGTAARSAVDKFGRLGIIGGLCRSHISLLLVRDARRRGAGKKKERKRRDKIDR